MADVTTTFAAKDESFAKTVNNLQGRLQGFQGSIDGFSSKVGAMAGGFGRAVGPLAALAAGFIGARSAVSSFSDAINVAGKLNELAARTGASAGELAVLQRAFQNAGSSAEAVGPMINRLQRFLVEGAEGGKSQAAAMQKLGLSFDDLRGKSPSEQMQILAERISAVRDPAQRTALAMEIFGRSGGELMPLLRSMGVEIQNARDQLGGYPEAVTRSAAALDAIGDNFTAIAAKAREFITGALVNIAPELARITEEIAKIDFAAMGMNLADAMQRAYDFFRGLFADPSQIFSLYGDYLEATMRLAGDMLITAFETAFKFFINTWQALISSDTFGKFADVLANAFLYGVANLNMALLNMIEGVLSFWGQLWGSVTQGGVSGFASKLFDVVKFFASDFFQALSNPVAFIAGKLTSSLLGAAQQGAEAYRFSWDSATGSIIDKARAGLQGAIDETGGNLRASASDFGGALTSSLTTAVEQTDVVKRNFFGSNEAMAQLASSASAIADNGASFRESSQTAAGAIATAKTDVQGAVDLTTGPGGIAAATKEAADRTQAASGSMSSAFDSVAKAGPNLEASIERAANNFGLIAIATGREFKQEIMGAFHKMFDGSDRFATEATQKQVLKTLETLAEKLPQPVLV